MKVNTFSILFIFQINLGIRIACGCGGDLPLEVNTKLNERGNADFSYSLLKVVL